MGQNESAQVSASMSSSYNNSNKNKSVSSTSRPIQRPGNSANHKNSNSNRSSLNRKPGAQEDPDEYDSTEVVAQHSNTNGKGNAHRTYQENGKSSGEEQDERGRGYRAPKSGHKKKKRVNRAAEPRSPRNVAANDVELIVRKKLITTTTTTTMTPLDISLIGGNTSNNNGNQTASDGANSSSGGGGGGSGSGDDAKSGIRKSNSFGRSEDGFEARVGGQDDDNSEVKADNNEKTDQPAHQASANPPPKIMNLITTQRIVNQQQANPSSTADAVAAINSINNLDGCDNNVIISSTCSLQQISGDHQGLDDVLADLTELKDQLKLDLCENLNGNGILSGDVQMKSSPSNVFIDDERSQDPAGQLNNLVQAGVINNNANKLTSTVKKEQLEYEFRLKPKMKKSNHRRKGGRGRQCRKRNCKGHDEHGGRSKSGARKTTNAADGSQEDAEYEDDTFMDNMSRLFSCRTNKDDEDNENGPSRNGIRCCCLCCGCRSNHNTSLSSSGSKTRKVRSTRSRADSQRPSSLVACLASAFSLCFFCLPSRRRREAANRYRRNDEADESLEENENKEQQGATAAAVASEENFDRSLCCSKGYHPGAGYNHDDDDDDSGSGIYGRRTRRCIFCVAIDYIAAKKNNDYESSECSDDDDDEDEDGSQDDPGSNSNSDPERRDNEAATGAGKKLALKKRKFICKYNRDNHSDECDDLIENPPPVTCIRVLRPSNDLTPVRFDSHYNIIQSISTGSISGGMGTNMEENHDEYNEEDENAAAGVDHQHEQANASALAEATSSDEDEFAGQYQSGVAGAGVMAATNINELNFDVIDGDEGEEADDYMRSGGGQGGGQDFYKISHTNQEKSF